MHATLAMSPRARTIVYAVIGAVSLAVGAFQVGYAALDAPAPDWLTVALAVVPFLAAGLGYTAATHTPSEKTTVEPARHLDGDGDGVADAAQPDGVTRYPGEPHRADPETGPYGRGGYMSGQ